MKTSIVIIGVTGDLSRRKLLPALEQIRQNTDHEFDIVGISRREVNIGELVGETLAPITRMVQMDLADLAAYERLFHDLALNASHQALVYLSVPPLAVTQIVSFLGRAGFNNANVKLLFEKPFGIDLDSAEDMVEQTRRYFSEDHMYRIDHYLAKEMAQNVVAFRTHNALFARAWNNDFIDSIEIIASENIDIEGRAEFYEQTGALRDVLQGHLMQLLALTIMDTPAEISWEELPSYRLSALRNLESAEMADSFRAQYEGYQEEVKNIGSTTETFVALTLASKDKKWQGVPLSLMAGKALAEKTTEIRVHFKPLGSAASNCLRFRIQPNEGVEIDLMTKKPGYVREFEPQAISFNYPVEAQLPDAYEQVLVDAIESRKSLFTSSDEILESWRVLQPLIHSWAMGDVPMGTYAKGTAIESLYQPT
jgi:glucose-6-phosphate 1-dehydrogenase